MSKPWEVSEIVAERGPAYYEGDRWLYAGPEQEIGYVSERAPGGADVWAAMFKASPAMVQALLEQGQKVAGEWHTYACLAGHVPACPASCRRARAALTKAGVPLR